MQEVSGGKGLRIRIRHAPTPNRICVRISTLRGGVYPAMDDQSKRIVFCCPGFENAASNVERPGLSVYANDLRGSPVFFVEFWALAPEHREQFDQQLKRANIAPAESIRLVLSGQHAIAFCPWCGRRLSRAYRKTWQKLLAPDNIGYGDET